MLEVARDVTRQIRFIQEACQEVAANMELLVAQTTLQSVFCLVWVDNQSEFAEDILRFEDID